MFPLSFFLTFFKKKRGKSGKNLYGFDDNDSGRKACSTRYILYQVGLSTLFHQVINLMSNEESASSVEYGP